MKVCTDACLFGAWVADYIRQNPRYDTVLDIGTGTGLLSLMLAQQSPAKIDAIEIEAHCAAQAKENTEASPWANRIQIIQGDIQCFQPVQPYSFIISNPPFFENDLQAADPSKNKAKHSTHLSLKVLFSITRQYLSPVGEAAFLLPYHRYQEAQVYANENALYPQEMIHISQTPLHKPFRTLLRLGQHKTKTSIHNFSIKINDGYSKEAIKLLTGYYLAL